MRLNQNYPPIYLHVYARVLATLKRYSEALPQLARLVKLMPTSTNSQALFAACNTAVDRINEAEAATAQLLQISPNFSLSIEPNALSEDLDIDVNVLRQTSLPEDCSESKSSYLNTQKVGSLLTVILAH